MKNVFYGIKLCAVDVTLHSSVLTPHDEVEPNLKKKPTETEYEVWKLLSSSFTIIKKILAFESEITERTKFFQ